jgi:hypothetical protein
MRFRKDRQTIHRYWLALTSALWLCALPLLLRKYPLPVLLERTTAAGSRTRTQGFADLDRTVGTLSRLCQLPFFHLPIFPRDCLRQSLVLYRALARRGYPAVIHFGVWKKGSVLEGHSWVTLDDKALGPGASPAAFTTVYSFPFAKDGQRLEKRIASDARW